MGKNLDRLKQAYALSTPGMAQTLSAMGRGNDSLVAHITPQEAMLLKQRGGAGTINPRTGLLEFYDSEGDGGSATDSGNPTGGDGYDSGYGSGNDMASSLAAPDAAIAEGFGPESPGYTPSFNPGMFSISDAIPGASVVNATGLALANPDIPTLDQMLTDDQSFNFANSFIGGPVGLAGSLMTEALTSMLGAPERGAETPEESSASPNNAGGGYDNSYMPPVAASTDNITTGGTTTGGTTTGGTTTTTPATQGSFQFAQPASPAFYGHELNRLMQQYGVGTPSTLPYGGAAFSTAQTDPAKYAYDQKAYQDYVNAYNGRLTNTNMYNMAQFTPNADNFRQQYAAPVAAPTYGGTFNEAAYLAANPDVAAAVNAKQIESGAQHYLQYGKNEGRLLAPGMGLMPVGYAEGGEVEDPNSMVVTATPLTPEPMTPDQASRYRELMIRYLPSTNYGPQLATAQQAARSEAEAFSNMIRQMSERAESPTSRAEMYFRLASAFGAPTRTGQFTENLALAGREMGEYAKGRRADEAERRALGLRAQELRMAGARQDLASLQALAGQASAERRAIIPRIIEAEVRANTPNARETRINDVMQTLGVGRPIAIGIVENIIQVIPGGPSEPPVLVNRATGEIIPTRTGTAPAVGTRTDGQPTGQPTGQPAEQPTGQPAEQPAATPSAPTDGEIPAVNLRRQQAAPTVPAMPSGATVPAAPASVEDFYAGRRLRQVEQAGRTAEAEARGRVSAPPAPRQDYRYTQGFEGVEPIPGSLAERERRDRERAERVRRETTQQMGGTVIRAIDDIQQTMRTATFPTTGYFGRQLSTLGGSAANNIRTDIETIRSNIGIDQLNQMRQASPTGAALGSVTDRENTILQSLLGNLDQSQTEAQFLRNLRRLRETYTEIINYGIGNRPPVQIPGPGGRGTAEPPARGEIRTPSGLTIRPIQ